MKHKSSVTLILLSMFLLTQFIGLLVVHSYFPVTQTIVNPETGETETIVVNQALPYGLATPEDVESGPGLFSIIFSFAVAVGLIFILMKYKWKIVIRIWFFVVVIIALSLSINALLKIQFVYSSIIALVLAVPLAYFKIYRPSVIIHNATELLIYPGIAAVFVPILSWWSIIVLLVLISLYDIWAVWHSGVMQKMAKFQMEELKVFGGFFVPYMSKKVRAKIKKLRKSKKKKDKEKKVKVSLAILGGGDVVFPIITAGVFLKAFGFIPAVLVIIGAFLGLTYLLFRSEKKKFYPAMPFISAGIFIGMIVAKIGMMQGWF